MTMAPSQRNSSRTYRCTVCNVKQSGRAGLIACPDCGGELVPLYVSAGERAELTNDDVRRMLRGGGS